VTYTPVIQHGTVVPITKVGTGCVSFVQLIILTVSKNWQTKRRSHWTDIALSQDINFNFILKKTYKTWLRLGVVGGLVVSVPAIGPKIHGFKRSWGNGFLRAIKIHSTTSFGGEVSHRPYVVRFYGLLNLSPSKHKRDSLLRKVKINHLRQQFLLPC
jgi:hypothetical protein